MYLYRLRGWYIHSVNKKILLKPSKNHDKKITILHLTKGATTKKAKKSPI